MYLTVDELKSEISEKTLIQLSNDDYQATVINIDVVDKAIAYACEFIDGHLRSRHTLPLSKSHTILTQLAIDISTYRLYKRRPEGSDIPTAVIDANKAAIKTLQAIQDGKLHLGIKGLAENDTAPSHTEFKVSAGKGVDTAGY
ncbi:MAG: DUF1320 domain-containing protein [Gammaproteobacteria bacterium]|nr:DUF1320 domain-containing protein [Gammaproteobacteria bacterium]